MLFCVLPIFEMYSTCDTYGGTHARTQKSGEGARPPNFSLAVIINLQIAYAACKAAEKRILPPMCDGFWAVQREDAFLALLSIFCFGVRCGLYLVLGRVLS